MTLPDERYRSVKQTSEFLQRLAGGEYPRVPKAVRQEAYRLLRHYPTGWDLQRTARMAPEVFQEQMEPLYRMVKQHDQQQTAAESQYTASQAAKD